MCFDQQAGSGCCQQVRTDKVDNNSLILLLPILVVLLVLLLIVRILGLLVLRSGSRQGRLVHGRVERGVVPVAVQPRSGNHPSDQTEGGTHQEVHPGDFEATGQDR